MSVHNDPSLTVNKICIDSRFRSSGKSDTDFAVELPETVYLPVGTRCHVSDVCLVHAWYTVEPNVNDRIYFSYKMEANTYNKVIILPSQNYDLTSLTEALTDLFNTLVLQAPAWMNKLQPAIVLDPRTGTFFIEAASDDEGLFFSWGDD